MYKINSVRDKFNSKIEIGKYNIKLLKFSCLPVKFSTQVSQLYVQPNLI